MRHLVIKAYAPLGQQLLQIAAGKLWNQLCQGLVQPNLVLHCRHLHLAQLQIRIGLPRCAGFA